jgi:hypothetical protein
MSDVVSEAPPAAGPPDRGAKADAGEPFGMHVRGTPPLTWLAVVACLLAMVLNQLLLPALNDQSRRAMLRDLGRWGAFATNLAAISGTIALAFGLLAFVRYSSVTNLRQRILLGWFGGFVFLPTLAIAVLLESQTTAQTVLFAFGAAQVLAITVSISAARTAQRMLPKTIAYLASAVCLFAVLAQTSSMLSRIDVRGWHVMAQLQRTFQWIGEVGYLLLLTSMSALLMPARRDSRARAGRLIGFFILPIVLGSLYLAERVLAHDYALLLYHAQRVSLFIDSWPRLYSAPLGLAIAGSIAAIVGGTPIDRQGAAGVLLLIGSGYAPHTPGRLLTWALAMVLIARSIITRTQLGTDVDRPA